MNVFFKPAPGFVGDTIPYFHDGHYHVFYLKAQRDPETYGPGHGWDHLSTVDFVHWQDHGEAIPRGAFHDYDLTVATGSLFTDANDQHHIFYTGINPYLRDDAHHSQVLMHATSPDLETWTKQPDHLWYPDESIFERHDWRDPFVYQHPKTGRYQMLVAARLKEGPLHRRGCTALLTSDNLVDWLVGTEPFYAPFRYHGHECPDLFRMGDWYYLVFSEYTTRTVTRYVMSRTPDGPWIAPPHNHFDNRAFYAAKTASDGNRRFLFGWNPTKVDNRDSNDWQWAGCLTVHEIVQRTDGTLGVRLPPEVRDAFGKSVPLALQHRDPGWEDIDSGVRAESPHRYSMAQGEPISETFLLEGELTFDAPSGSAGLLLRLDGGGNTGFFLRFNPEDNRLEFGRIGGYRDWYLDNFPELDRPLTIESGTPIQFTVIVDKTAVVAWVNDEIALSGRLYDNPHGACGLFVDGTSAVFRDLAVRPWQD